MFNGVATTDPHLQKALVVEEKKHRVANYITTLRKGLFRVSAAAGLSSPVHFEPKHIMYKDDLGVVHPLEKILADIHSQIGTEEKY
ncbi:glutamate synthase-related protein [Pseudogracilibacillus sp. SE30717A]|uniref:glutamate synthase-related protein n=1 Tax=Pseudogracilibacillus sp. SE30717A TaxID=3098293 RepID=UPI003FA7CEF3